MGKRLAFTMVIAVAALQSAAATRYTITDLGSLGSGRTESQALGINDTGQVVGQSFGPNVPGHAFLYSGGVMTDLGALPGGTRSQAAGINNVGQIVGFSNAAAPNVDLHPFLYSSGTMSSVGPLTARGSASAINDSGTIVGETFVASDHAFSYSGGVMHDLGALAGGSSGATAVSANGLIAGWSYLGSTQIEHAFIYTGNTMRDLGTVSNLQNSYAYGVNSAGDVVDYVWAPSAFAHAFVYRAGRMYDLNTYLLHVIDLTATGINDEGRVVGWGEYQGGLPLAIVYQDGVMTDLQTLLPSNNGWRSLGPTGINNEGQIIGNGVNASGAFHAFLLTPVPEPTLLLLTTGAIPLLCRRRNAYSKGKCRG